ncbi:MAG: TlyA family RNA methyltransferase [Clostridia bacterium]|nr:TlyA family RNA methyltransferase [Clostridia bacterium]MBO7216291.1 TlyA family RNA methyltransferase [Clostridia bacterium]
MRIDLYLAEKGLAPSRSKAKEYIDSGKVFLNGAPVKKAGLEVTGTEDIRVMDADKFVSRAGRKLEAALEIFGIDVRGLSALDLGASTGGFTDCLLQRGAKRVIALDVGRDQLDTRLREDDRVFVMENTNARDIFPEDLPFLPDIITTDLSFISQTLVYPAVARVLEKGYFISLVKPQFEAGRENIGKGGIVKDKDGKIKKAVLEKIEKAASENGLLLLKTAPSPIAGGDGNTEYLALFERSV